MMTEENKFQKSILKEKKEDKNDSSEFFDSDPAVPDDETIDQRFRCLDEVTDHFYEEQLLGPNTHRSVLSTAQIAKQGQINLSKTKNSDNKGKSKGI